MSTKLLLVEDNELNRDMLTRRLIRKGFEVVTAEDGLEALEKMRQYHPDVVLMDLNLPILSGWEACKIATNDPDLADIPMLALTAHALEKELKKALDAGCKDYATKPIDFPVLLRKIAGLLNP